LGYKERVKLISDIEKHRDSRLVSYVLSDRAVGPPAIINDDAISPLHEQLESIGKQEKIDLFLYTRGGSLPAAFRIAKLFREYCKTFSVLVPFRAHSAGTQICLAAEKIVMGVSGELSPVDPSTQNPFNPTDRSGNLVPISVEDVMAYLKLARERAGLISESSKLETFKILTAQAPALALGNVARYYEEARRIVEDLLSLHMDPVKEQAEIEKIKHFLTEEYPHEHYITYDEAKTIGLSVERADATLQNLISRLLADYEADLQIKNPLDPEAILAQQPTVNFDLWYGLIESSGRSYVNVGGANVSRPVAQPIQLNLPGVPTPVTITPHPSSLPVSVKFKPARWVDVAKAPANA
jgi:serine dehydrogenase proteinase